MRNLQGTCLELYRNWQRTWEELAENLRGTWEELGRNMGGTCKSLKRNLRVTFKELIFQPFFIEKMGRTGGQLFCHQFSEKLWVGRDGQ